MGPLDTTQPSPCVPYMENHCLEHSIQLCGGFWSKSKVHSKDYGPILCRPGTRIMHGVPRTAALRQSKSSLHHLCMLWLAGEREHIFPPKGGRRLPVGLKPEPSFCLMPVAEDKVDVSSGPGIVSGASHSHHFLLPPTCSGPSSPPCPVPSVPPTYQHQWGSSSPPPCTTSSLHLQQWSGSMKHRTFPDQHW